MVICAKMSTENLVFGMFKSTPGFQATVRHLGLDMVRLNEQSSLDVALDLLNTGYATPAGVAALERLKADPAIAELIQERYWGHWPDLATLTSLPEDTLGYIYGHLMQQQGLQPLPPPVIPATADGDDAYILHRTRATHDLWHAVTGVPTTLAGETTILAIYTEQLRSPGYALLVAAALIHRADIDAPENKPGVIDLGQAVSYGLELGRQSAPLLAQRWEEGWERPVSEWRDALGISTLVNHGLFSCRGQA